VYKLGKQLSPYLPHLHIYSVYTGKIVMEIETRKGQKNKPE